MASTTDLVEPLVRGSRVWLPAGGAGASGGGGGEQAWLPAEISALDAGACVLALPGGATATVDRAALIPANPAVQDGIPELTHLTYLNEPCILANFGHRYAADRIYTFAGPVLVALNPCRELPLYGPDVQARYKGGATEQLHGLEPHVFIVAANAFREMVREGTSQSLVVSGESGAGKTETTKKAMQYFATLAGGTGVEDQVLEVRRRSL